jgi:CRP/FNR family cyclic AMP-dependent transcriptional regulator
MPNKKPSFESNPFLTKAFDGKTVANYAKKKVVFTQGDSADTLLYVQEGKVKLTVISKQGKEAILACVFRRCRSRIPI